MGDQYDIPDEPLAGGRTAEVFALSDDTVVKLLRPGFSPDLVAVEAARTRAAHEAGAPAPGVHDQIEIQSRPGLVLDRVVGDSLLDEAAMAPLRLWHWARVFADVHIETMKRTTDELPDIKDVYAEKIESADITYHQQTV
ncbi:MAG: hypothetical protein ABFR95_10930, partial [Actinomycetota bacterium]